MGNRLQGSSSEEVMMNNPPVAAGNQAIVAALERLEKRLDRIESRLDEVSALRREAPAMLAMITDTADSAAARAAERGVDIDARLRAALSLVERVTAPETMAMIEGALGAAESAPRMIAMATDTLDSLVARAGSRGIDVEERLRVLAAVAERLTSPVALAAVREVLDRIDVVQRLLESGVLAEAPVAVVEQAALAMAETCAEHPRPIGPFGAFRAMSDPGVQRAMGFALRFAKRFGESLETTSAPRLPAASA
jgi:uncharacterized protein YjgD (DUF1641 family)